MHTTFSYKFLLCLALTHKVHVYNSESSLQVKLTAHCGECACLSVRKHISGTTCAMLSKFPVHVKCDRFLLAALRHVMYFLSHLDTVAANDVIASNCKAQATAPNASYRHLIFQSYTMAVTESGCHAKCTGSLQRITVLIIRVTVHC